jgi:hypothetical protein
MPKHHKKGHEAQEKKMPPKVDHRVHPTATTKGRRYKFTDKHHYPPKGDHSCWLRSITREVEFSMFQGAEDGHFGDEHGNLYNVHFDNGEYVEIGTKHELMAKFWHSGSVAEWHGHPIWPIRVKGAFNRKNQGYEPPALALERMVAGNRITQRDADRLSRGDYP